MSGQKLFHQRRAGRSDDRAVIAATRFGLGMGVNDRAAIGGRPQAWLKQQTLRPATQARARESDEVWADQRHRVRQFRDAHRANSKALKRAADAQARADLAQERKILEKYFFQDGSGRLRDEFQWLAHEAVTTSRPFTERLVRFWVNHFAVRPRNNAMLMLLPAFEHQVVRPFVNGRFRDMLLAAESHPLMLMFLDNVRSFGPNSVGGKRRGAGLNENLAREVLELHTLGVNGGYGQSDVAALAAALTGWTVSIEDTASSDEYGNFWFREAVHEPGDVTLLGRRYADVPGAGGVLQAQAILSDLAGHPSTATYLSYKLAQHFIADDPDPADVKRLADVYLAHDGDLGEVYRVLIEMEAAWQAPLSKLKQPWDYGLSSLRVCDVRPDKQFSRYLFGQLRAMGQPAYRPPGPQGWYDRTGDWADTSSLLVRANWARALSEKIALDEDALEIGARALGGLLPQAARDVIGAPPRKTSGKAEALALLIASPSFQRR